MEGRNRKDSNAMKTKQLLLLTLMALCAASAWAADFSAVSPSGHTLYYNIVDGHAEVVRPGTGGRYVAGDVVIPDTVTYNGISYAVTALAAVGAWGTFENCNDLTSVTIPSGVTTYINIKGAFII